MPSRYFHARTVPIYLCNDSNIVRGLQPCRLFVRIFLNEAGRPIGLLTSSMQRGSGAQHSGGNEDRGHQSEYRFKSVRRPERTTEAHTAAETKNEQPNLLPCSEVCALPPTSLGPSPVADLFQAGTVRVCRWYGLALEGANSGDSCVRKKALSGHRLCRARTRTFNLAART